MTIEVNVKGIVYKAIDEVFSVIVNPSKIVGYFISSASDKIKEGLNII